MMRKFSLTLSLFLAFLVPVLLFGTGSGLADDRDHRDNRDNGAQGGPISLLTTIPVPGLVVFDISWVDPDTQLYYLADRSNAAIDIIDARRDVFVGQIKPTGTQAFRGFTGNNDTSGPNGVVVSGRWLFVTDANSRVVSIDLTTGQIVGDVRVGGADGLRTDELAYDPEDGILLAVNNADDPPFATLIKVETPTGHLTVGTRITLKSTTTPPGGFAPGGFTATNGAEQPVWDRSTGRFYLSIPEVNGNGGKSPSGAVARISPSGTLEALFKVDFCQPAGLTVGPHGDLLLGCSVVFDTAGKAWDPTDTNPPAPVSIIMDARTGAIDKRVAGISGSDEVWFNPGDQRYYLAARADPLGPVLGVIDAESQTLIQQIPTFNTPSTSPAPRGTAHSVAVNPRNNHVFAPLPANNVPTSICRNGCVAVFGPSNSEPEDDE
jgi:hypothetical protein